MNTNQLKAKIVGAGYTQRALAKELNMSTNALNSKINGRTPFNTNEVVVICDLLAINDNAERAHIFLS